MARVTLTGAPGPKGDKGDPGADGTDGVPGAPGADAQQPTFTIGTVTTGAAGSSASVTISGGPVDYIIDVTIPRGNTGANGTNGTNGSTPNVTIGTVTTLAAGASATATISGTTPNLVLNLGIPQGVAGTGSSAATTTAIGSVQLAGDLAGWVNGSQVTTATAPRVTETATVPMHEHSRTLRLLPQIQHSSGFTAATYDLPLADSVIILNGNVTLNLPVPQESNSNFRGMGSTDPAIYYDSGGVYYGLRDGSLSGSPRLGQATPLRNFSTSTDSLVGSPTLAQAHWEIAVTLIQDETGGRTVTWRQNAHLSGTGFTGNIPVTVPGTTARKAVTVVFRWAGPYVGWIPVAVSPQEVTPALNPVDSGSTKYIRAFTPTNQDAGLTAALVSYMMLVPEAVRKFYYDIGVTFSATQQAVNGTSAPIWGQWLSFSKFTGTVGAYTGGVYGSTSDYYKEAWFRSSIIGTDIVPTHEFGHCVDYWSFKGNAKYPAGRSVSFPAGTYFDFRGTSFTTTSTTTRTIYTICEHPVFQAHFQYAYGALSWSGRNSYNVSAQGNTLAQMREWMAAAVGGYLVSLTDATLGDAQMSNSVPPDDVASVKADFATYVFGSSALNLL